MKQDDGQWQLLTILLKEIAKQKGITHQQISDSTGLIRSHISRIFRVKYPPSLKDFLSIAKAIGVNFFIEHKDTKTNLNVLFEKDMEDLGRRAKAFPKN